MEDMGFEDRDVRFYSFPNSPVLLF
jgi:hypothetical protein